MLKRVSEEAKSRLDESQTMLVHQTLVEIHQSLQCIQSVLDDRSWVISVRKGRSTVKHMIHQLKLLRKATPWDHCDKWDFWNFEEEIQKIESFATTAKMVAGLEPSISLLHDAMLSESQTSDIKCALMDFNESAWEADGRLSCQVVAAPFPIGDSKDDSNNYPGAS